VVQPIARVWNSDGSFRIVRVRVIGDWRRRAGRSKNEVDTDAGRDAGASEGREEHHP